MGENAGKQEKLDERENLILASRGARLGAAIIDMVIMVAIFLALYFVTGLVDGLDKTSRAEASLLEQLVMAAVGVAIYAAINWTLLEKNGQTIGKKALGIRIVAMDGSAIGAATAVFKRYLPFSCIPCIPVVGNAASLIAVLLIFAPQKRCLHDFIAGTKVVYCQ